MSDKKKETKKIDAEKLNEKIEELEKKLETTEESLKRSMAELENFRRRTAEERCELIKSAGTEAVSAILPVLDNFETAFKNIPENANTAWVEGFRSIYQSLLTSLEKIGLKKIETEGESFDPDLHEALMSVPGKKDTVINEISAGYTLNGKVIRHARVQIGNGEK